MYLILNCKISVNILQSSQRLCYFLNCNLTLNIPCLLIQIAHYSSNPSTLFPKLLPLNVKFDSEEIKTLTKVRSRAGHCLPVDFIYLRLILHLFVAI